MIKIPFQNFPNFIIRLHYSIFSKLFSTITTSIIHLYFKENNPFEITSYRNWLNLSFPLFPILSQHPKIIT